MKRKYKSRRQFDQAEFDRNYKKRKIVSWLTVLLIIPFILFVVNRLISGEHYMLISLLIIAGTILPLMISFEYRKPRAREIVLLAVLISFCVVSNLICSHTIPLHAGTAMVVLAGISMGPEAGFLTGALGRFVCNFFDGQGIWTPWQMTAWGIIGFISGVSFRKVEKGEKGSRFSIFICVGAGVIAGYFVNMIIGKSDDFVGVKLYLWMFVGLLTGVILQRKKLPIDRFVMSAYTFIIVFVFYGGIMNFAAMLMQNSYSPSENPINADTLRALYVTGAPYDFMHALGAAFCIFLIGESLLGKLERIQIKYGIYTG
ncbi:MAG: ECF transporter S component [Lachnospiraceae bacterium]|nr:ECF transporter S component [Lachnospiraceae bacterium]